VFASNIDKATIHLERLKEGDLP